MNSFKHYLLILAISLLPFLIILINPNLPHTSDGGVQLPRIAAYVKALSDGHIPVRWAGDLNYGYGLPLFNFMYQFPYFLGAFFVALGSGLVLSFKLILLSSFLLSGVFMYLFAQKLLKDEKKALLVTLFYQFAPFRLVELLVRGGIGSGFAYAFLPLVLLGAVRRSFFLTAFATSLLIVSHNSLSLVFFGIAFVYGLVISPSKKTFLLSLLTGLCLASFYWVPALFERSYTYGDLFMKDLYKTNFPPLVNFFVPNFTNDVRLRTAEISVQFGFFHVIGLILAVIFIWKRKIKDMLTKKLLVTSLILTFITLYFMQPLSINLWENFGLLRQFQFPWRFLAVITFTTSLLSLSYFQLRKNAFYLPICILVVLSTAFYWYPPQGFDRVKAEKDFWNYPLNTTYFGETDLVWSAGPATKYPENRIQIIEGIATITEFVKKTQIHTFSVNAETPVRLVDHTQYFPGWRVYVDNVKVPVEFQDANWRGLITFAVPAGNHSVRVTFGESKTRIIADLITLASASGLILAFLWIKRKRLVPLR
ncbi:hypothetical protein A3A79_04695 [Candidatus Gottesmanbacteria bacterium RIFCSPLOWO2_01_FULL_43_11b]|uniref:Membrane protein 6-pyruvoyl-tetrahydropterin synthase-related domain-containing protein n=1 Tax=Candidatus Gottesmanbacteria bacterium RIFCSPLOWO2_01_FULL_43_11b TaxID=1798392 RepID=A0A1F6AJ42_9BACT|nr:MAG: hypothetical protein A3A79_04695 [Candidatus Gottesmanbacteria bacterium RIFCSPLOWO2_01_FULL_43_11b]